jgi:hypothetical protein
MVRSLSGDGRDAFRIGAYSFCSAQKLCSNQGCGRGFVWDSSEYSDTNALFKRIAKFNLPPL